MNPALLLTLSSFLIFGFISNLPLAFSQEKVRDFQGVPISSTIHYVIGPATFGPTGGGIRLGAEAGNPRCPVAVLQDYSEINPGLPVKFTVLGNNTGDGAIYIGTPLDIEFVNKPMCATSSKWVIVVDNYPGKWLGIGGANDHPRSKQIISGTFNIQRYKTQGYKLVFCPTNGNCSDIESTNEDDGRRLTLANSESDLFTVRFTKKI